MISSLDDLLVHQTATPISQPGTTDRNFTDRYYFNAYSPDGECLVIIGMTQYPNRGVMDSFVLARFADGRQFVTRASRQLDDRAETAIGPISIRVLEPLTRFRVSCAGGEGAIALDLVWHSDCAPIQEPPMAELTNFGRVLEDGTRFVQTGSWEGTLRIDGKDFLVDCDWHGSRDRSWGIRRLPDPWTGNSQRHQHVPDGLILWTPMRFLDATIHLVLFESSTGDRTRVFCQQVPHFDRPGRVQDLDVLGVTFDARLPTHAFASAELGLRYRSSQELLQITASAHVVAALSAGTGYGGAGETDWIHGMYHGPLAVDHKSYELHAALASGSTTTTVAFFESSNPLLGTGTGVVDLRVQGEMAAQATDVGNGYHRVHSKALEDER